MQFVTNAYKTFRQTIAVTVAGAISSLALPTVPALAQSAFSPAIVVNEDVITWFELDQRAQFLRLLRVPGDPDEEARKTLIEDKLKRQSIGEAGITVAPEDVKDGIEKFASRTELSAEEFIKALEQGGVAYETLRDFTEISLAWRENISARFLSKARPTDAEIDRALGQGGGLSGVQVRFI